MNNYDRHVIALDDNDLERFVRDWVSAKSPAYHEVARFSGAGDLGRDVVGFHSKDRHEGDWDNYQCKQYGGRLPTATAIHEIGKILYYAHIKDEFTAPNRYYFVTPRGLNRTLEKLVFNPKKFKETLISEWDKYCATSIIDGETIELDPKLKSFIDDYDFAKITRVTVDDMLADPHIKPVLYSWFDADPGPAPAGITPDEIQSNELTYIAQLLEAYGTRLSEVFTTTTGILKYPLYAQHLKRQRERFFDADAFKRFYRDNTNIETIAAFEKEIFHGIIETHEGNYSDALERVDQVMKQAATIHPSGPLANHTRVTVKQGICHHFANENQIKWNR